jgi:hypothetical protein
MTYPYQRVFFADVGVDELDQRGFNLIQHKGVELSAEDWNEEELPYWEFHIGKIPGRWLGVGVVETLFEPQIRHNEIVNLQSKTSYWAALRLFQTRDPAVNRNLLTDTRNGEVLSVDSEITQIDMSDRNLAFFNVETAKWDKNIDSLTLAFAPVGTSVVAVEVAQQQVISYFKQIQQDIAMDIKEMIYEVIIPQFEKDQSAEHTLRLVGKDLDAYIAMVKNEFVLKEVIRLAVNFGKVSTQEEADAIGIAVGEAIKQEKEKIITIPKDFYKDVKYDIDIDILGESVDTKARYAARMAMLQAITSDPTMTTDPVKKRFLYGMAEDAGINPSDLFEQETKSLEQMIPQDAQMKGGGGVSAPMNMPSMPGSIPMKV